MSKTLAARICKGHALKGHALKGHALKGHALKGHTATGVIAAATALAFSLAAVMPGAAATRHGKTVPAPVQNTYRATSEGDPPPGMTAGQVGHRINPTLPGSNGFGPPDPASCGGFNC